MKKTGRSGEGHTQPDMAQRVSRPNDIAIEQLTNELLRLFQSLLRTATTMHRSASGEKLEFSVSASRSGSALLTQEDLDKVSGHVMNAVRMAAQTVTAAHEEMTFEKVLKPTDLVLTLDSKRNRIDVKAACYIPTLFMVCGKTLGGGSSRTIN